MGVVEYIEDDEAAISRMARILKPNGVLIVTLPNRLSPYRLWARIVLNRRILDLIKRFIMRKEAPTLIHREYRERDYGRLLTARGFNVLDVVYYNFNVAFFPIDRLLPGLSVSIARKLERHNRGNLRWLGTGFIVKAKKDG